MEDISTQNKVEYLVSRCIEKGRKGLMVKERKKLLGKTVLNNDGASVYIQNVLRAGRPAMICRFGNVEACAVDAYLRRKMGFLKEYSSDTVRTMTNNAGFFAPDDCMAEMLDRFGAEMLDACKDIDLIGIWNECEPYILKKYASSAVSFCRLGGISPKSAYPNQWTSALAGKKVLVVHPFEKSIRSQYTRRELIFPNGFLPEFELHTVKAVQSAAGEKDERFRTWFEALDYMKAEMDKIDYDVAIIGCGAYGFLLAQHAKKQGKIALHLGGAVQMMFGIMGKRWENTTKHFVNEYWVKPLPEETPVKSVSVEQGCYW